MSAVTNKRCHSTILTQTIRSKLYGLLGGGISLFRHTCIFEEIRGIIKKRRKKEKKEEGSPVTGPVRVGLQTDRVYSSIIGSLGKQRLQGPHKRNAKL